VRLTDGKSRNSLHAVSRDGKKMIIASNKRNPRDTDLYVANPRKPNSMTLVYPTSRQFWYGADWSPDARTLLLGRYVSINESYMALFHLPTKKRTDLPLPTKQKAAIGELAFSADGKSVYLSTDVRGEFAQLARLDLATKKFNWLTDDIPWDVAGLAIDEKSDRVAFGVNEDGATKLYLLEGGKRRPLPIPLGIASALTFSPGGRHLGFSLSRPDAPTDCYSLDTKSNRLTRWTYSEVGGLDASQFVRPRRVQFKTFDGRMIPAYYFRPHRVDPKKPIPVLIRIHGGPESQYRPYFSSVIQYYVNELGMAVIAPNVRGSAGYGKTYLKLDNGPLRENSVKDIGALLDWIGEQPELDEKRVAVYGGSYGGYMVLGSLTNFGDRIRAGVDIVGIANFITFLKNTASYRRDLRRAEYGDERDPKMRAVFEKVNPTANAEKIKSALLVAHGKNDPRVPFSEAQQIAEKVRSLDRPVWTVYANNEGHGFGKKVNADYLQAAIVMFLKSTLTLNRGRHESTRKT